MGDQFRVTDLPLGGKIHTKYLIAVDLTDPGKSGHHTGNGLDTSRDLLQFDPQTPQFYLPVCSASDHDLAVGGPIGDVTGIIQSILMDKGAAAEYFFRQIRAITIALAHALAANEQPAAAANGQRIHPLIQHIHSAVAHRRAHGDLIRRRKFLHTGNHGGLGGAILVIDPGVGAKFQLFQQLCGEMFTTADNALHPPHHLTEGIACQQGRQTGGSHGKESNRVAIDERCQALGRLQIAVRGEHNGAAIEQRHDAFQHEGIKAHIAYGQHCALTVYRLHLLSQVQHAALGDLHALRLAGTAGGIDHIGHLIPCRLVGFHPIGHGQAVVFVHLIQRQHRDLTLPQAQSAPLIGDHHRCAALPQDLLDPLLRQALRQDQIGTILLQRTNHRRRQIKGSGQHNRYQRILAFHLLADGAGELGAAVQQRTIGHSFAVMDDGRTVEVFSAVFDHAIIDRRLLQIAVGLIKGIQHLLLFFQRQHIQIVDGLIRLGQRLAENMAQIAMQGCDLAFGKALGQIVIVHRILLVVLQIGQMDGQLLHLIAAVMPSSAEHHGGIPALIDLTVLIRQGDMEQSAVPTCQFADFGEGIALMTEHFIPILHQCIIEGIQGPIVLQRIMEGQRSNEHTRTLLKFVIGAVENRHANGKALRTAVALEINGQGHIKHRKGCYSLFLAVGENGVIDDLGQLKAHPSAHRAYGSTADPLQRRGLSNILYHTFPVFLIPEKCLGAQIILLLLHMELVIRCFFQRRLLTGQQFQIGLADLITQHHLGPAIGNDMVQLHQHTAAVLAVTEQNKPIQRTTGQGDQFSGNRIFPAFHTLKAGIGEVIHREFFLQEGCVILHYFSIHLSKLGAQGSIAFDHPIDALLQHGKIHLAPDPHRGADIIHRSSRQGLLQIPDIQLAQG